MTTPPEVEPVRGWVTPAFARVLWPDAPKNPQLLYSILDAAYEMCVAYAPHLAVPEDSTGYVSPQRCVNAQVLHARAIWTAARAKGDVLGLEDVGAALATTTPTLSGQIKQLLRPHSGPAIG